MTRLIADRLTERARRRGAEPLLTCYDLGSGERVELSAVSFKNWVDKTANLLVDEFAVDDRSRVGLPLARSHPGHWMTFVVEMACFQVGAAVDVSAVPTRDPEVVVTGPDWSPHVSEGMPLLACSLHPLGLGFPEPVPSPVTDFSLEVRAQPDVYAGPGVAAEAAAWVDADGTRSQRDLVAEQPIARRRLVRPDDPWSTCRDGLLAPIVSGGSTVLVVGADPTRLDRIVSDERVDEPSG